MSVNARNQTGDLSICKRALGPYATNTAHLLIDKLNFLAEGCSEGCRTAVEHGGRRIQTSQVLGFFLFLLSISSNFLSPVLNQEPHL